MYAGTASEGQDSCTKGCCSRVLIIEGGLFSGVAVLILFTAIALPGSPIFVILMGLFFLMIGLSTLTAGIIMYRQERSHVRKQIEEGHLQPTVVGYDPGPAAEGQFSRAHTYYSEPCGYSSQQPLKYDGNPPPYDNYIAEPYQKQTGPEHNL